MSLNWDPDKNDFNKDIGEVIGAKRPWNRGNNVFNQNPSFKPIGNAQDWFNGISIKCLDNPTIPDSTCCKPEDDFDLPCFEQCDKCPDGTAQLWNVEPPFDFCGLTESIITQQGSCKFGNCAYRDCDVCNPTADVWIVQVDTPFCGLTTAWIIQQGGCKFSNCCPQTIEV